MTTSFKRMRRQPVLAAGVLLMACSMAQPVAVRAQVSAQAPLAGQARTFDIPAQPLADGMTAFGRQSGLQVSVDATLVRDVSTSGVSGTLPPSQALATLLAGTGLVFRFVNATTVTLERPGAAAPRPGPVQLDPVRVQGNQMPAQADIGNLMPPYAGGMVATGGRVGILGNRDYMDTPFSTIVYTEKMIEDQQARTVVDIVANDPSIRSQYGQATYDDRLFIRGFPVYTQDFSFNGLYGVSSPYAIDLAGIERVEIFHGPTALLNGMSPLGAVGGTINLVPKRATAEPLTRLTALYLSDTQLGGQADIGRRFGPDDSLGLRLNAAYTGGNTPVQWNSDKLLSLTAGFDFRSDSTRVDADLGYLQRFVDGSRPNTTIAAGLQLPAAPNSRLNDNQPWSHYYFNDLYGMLRFEHDFTPDITAYAKVGGRRSNGRFIIGAPQILDAQGDTLMTPRRSVNYSESLSAEVGGKAKFTTGPVRHEMALSGSYLLTESGSLNVTLPAVRSNIYAPVTAPAPSLAGIPTQPVRTSQTLMTGVALADSLSALDDKLQLIIGGRLQRVQVSNYSAVTGLTTAATPGYDQSALTPAVGFVVRPWKALSFYGNYIEALQQGPVAAAGTTNAGQVFPPFVSNQYELGVKLDLGTFGATLSAFQITQPSAIVNATTNTLSVDGEQRNRGLELSMFGEPFQGFKPLGGITFLEGVLASTAGGVNNGKIAPGVPAVQMNLGFDWDTWFIKRFAVSARVIYTSLAYLDAANQQPVPAWTRVDLGARYSIVRADGKPVTLRADVVNVGNNNYWTASGTLSQSPPRTFLLSLSADF
ncbi:MAG: TonB-dependent siderophore receptor [Rhodospirillales bacterium]|nr:TonB-dependent siderophore receptor [Rhodospirillales bacterium]